MKIDGKITLLVDHDIVRIEIKDQTSRQVVIKAELTPEQFTHALSRIACTDIEKCEILNIERIGKTLQVDKIEFPMPEGSRSHSKEIARSTVVSYTPEGWIADKNFSSQDSFFSKDDKNYAKTTIRRWV